MDREKNRETIIQFVGKSLSTDNLNYKILQDDDELNVSSLSIGLLSGFCVWSGSTFSIGEKIITELSQGLTETGTPLLLLDCDSISPQLQQRLFNTANWGYFESCWIENGEILKAYKYKHELKPFLDFVKSRLKQISYLFKERENKAYILSPGKDNFGIDKTAFTSEGKAIIPSRSKYKNSFLYDLMKFEKEGNYYLFEDNNVVIYDATTPTHLSTSFIEIKTNKGRT